MQSIAASEIKNLRSYRSIKKNLIRFDSVIYLQLIAASEINITFTPKLGEPTDLKSFKMDSSHYTTLRFAELRLKASTKISTYYIYSQYKTADFVQENKW